MQTTSRIRIGIDFGGVIVKPWDQFQGEDTGRLVPEDETQAQPGVFDAVRKLVRETEGQIWIVSKAGERMQTATLEWLRSVDFFFETGLKEDHCLFCRERPEKAIIAQELQLTHFIDDRMHIMHILHGIVPNLIWFTPKDNNTQCPSWVTKVSDWSCIPA